MESKKLVKEEKKALKDTKSGKRYSINDFSFRFKSAPKYQNFFKEVEVSFIYQDERILYHYFYDKDLAKEEAIALAKKKVTSLINKGEIRSYAKKYFHRVY